MDKKTLLALKAKAHKLKPTVIIGNNGLTEGVQNEIDVALEAHELIKVRINAETREARDAMSKSICEFQRAELIGQIGHIITIYRRSDED